MSVIDCLFLTVVNAAICIMLPRGLSLIAMNQPVDLDLLVIPVRQQFISKAIQTVGATSLRTISEHLGDNYTYDEIKLVRAWWQVKNNS